MRWFRHVRTPPEHQKSIFRHSAIQFKTAGHKQHGTAVFVTLLLTQLRCRIQNDCYKLPRCLKTLCFCWSWGGRERKIKSCWMKIYVCGTVLGDRALWWRILMEQSIFWYFRGWELQAFCVELRAYKMQECHTASFLPACAWFAFPESCSNVIPSSNFGFMGHPHFLREDLFLKYCYLCSVRVYTVQLMLIMELYWRTGTVSKKNPKTDLNICFFDIDWGQTISLVPRNHDTSCAASLAYCSDKEHDV